MKVGDRIKFGKEGKLYTGILGTRVYWMGIIEDINDINITIKFDEHWHKILDLNNSFTFPMHLYPGVIKIDEEMINLKRTELIDKMLINR